MSRLGKIRCFPLETLSNYNECSLYRESSVLILRTNRTYCSLVGLNAEMIT